MNTELTKAVFKKHRGEKSGTNKQGKDWKRAEFIVETQGEYPKTVCLTVYNELCDSVRDLNDGDVLEVQGRIESREWNDRYYTDTTVTKLTVLQKADSLGF